VGRSAEGDAYLARARVTRRTTTRPPPIAAAKRRRAARRRAAVAGSSALHRAGPRCPRQPSPGTVGNGAHPSSDSTGCLKRRFRFTESLLMPTTVSHPSPSSPHLVVTDARTLTSGDLDLSVLQRFCRLQVYDYCGPALVERIRHAHIVITNKERLDAHTLSLLPDLRLIAVLATGTDNIDVAAAEQRGVVVSNVPGYSTASVAQHVFAMLLE